MAEKKVILLNQSRRLHTIGGVRILPTEAKEVPASVLESAAFKFSNERGELAVVDETREPILDEKEAREEAERRKKEGLQVNNGAPIKPQAKGRAKGGEGNGDA